MGILSMSLKEENIGRQFILLRYTYIVSIRRCSAINVVIFPNAEFIFRQNRFFTTFICIEYARYHRRH
jgi:hypothetical protein